MPSRIKNAALFLAFVSMLALPVLAQNRTIVRPAWNLFSPQQDADMGRVLADEADQTLQLAEQHNAQVYIDALGQQLAVHAPGNKYTYQFKIVNDDAINAYALPGGFIYVTSGLVQAAQNEPQLAGVLAHQIGHVVLRHGTAEVSQAYSNQVSNSTRNRISVNDAMSRLNIRFEPDSIVLKFSPQEERQAEVIATQIMVDTGFDPRQMTQFYQTLANGRSNRTSDFFNNHPNIANRAAVVNGELQNLGGLPRNIRGDSADFHSVKDKYLAVNTNTNPWPSTTDRRNPNRVDLPSNRMLTYRAWDIEFRYPDNWRISDQGDSILVAPDRGFVSGSLAYGMTIATFEPQSTRYFPRNSFAVPGVRPDTNTLTSATNQLINQLQESNPNMRVVRNSERTRVDGAQAMVVELTNDSPLGGIETNRLVTVLRPNGLLRYFIGVAPQRDFSRYQPAFDQIVASARFTD